MLYVVYFWQMCQANVLSSFANFLPYCDKRANCWHQAARTSAFLNFILWKQEREKLLKKLFTQNLYIEINQFL